MDENRTSKIIAIEMIGCAASGKSSVVRDLSEKNSIFSPYVSSRRYALACWTYTVLRLPKIVFMLLLGVHRHYLKTLIRIEAALADISSMKREANWGGVLLIDQGPLSSLAYLHYKGVSNRWIAKWMNYLQRKAVIILDKAFWLDAPNAVLIERLRKRKSGHIMEQFPDTKVNQFYNFYRIFYGKVLQDVNYELINTERLSIRDVSARIESEFALVTNSHEGEDICGA